MHGINVLEMQWLTEPSRFRSVSFLHRLAANPDDGDGCLFSTVPLSGRISLSIQDFILSGVTPKVWADNVRHPEGT